MLVDIFKEMMRIMILVDNYTKNSQLVVTELMSEVEKYQKQVKAMHPKQINRLLSHGGNKDKLFKRDFAKEIWKLFPNLKLLDYGFHWKEDPLLKNSCDNDSWFLFEKIK